MSADTLTVVVTLALAVGIVAAYLVARRIARRPDLGEAAELAAVFVQAAEQTLASAPGSEKLTWVMGELGKRTKHLDGTMLRALVEAAVFRLKQEQGTGVDG